jgi:hypothetical protein
MVVGHQQPDAARLQVGEQLGGPHAAVHGDEERWFAGGKAAFERGGGESVALRVAVGQEVAHAAAEVGNHVGQQGRAHHAIDVEVAKDDDLAPGGDRLLHALRRLAQLGDVHWIGQLLLEGFEKGGGGVGRVVSAGGQQRGQR